MRTKVRLLGLLAAPLLMAQCAPTCAPPAPPPPTPPARPPAALFGCVDSPDVYWWLNFSGVVSPGRDPLIGDRVTASVDGQSFSDPVTIGPHQEVSLAHFHGVIDAVGGTDVDLAATAAGGTVHLRANDLRACPVALVTLSPATLDCAGTLSVMMSLTVEGGQFDPPPQARLDVWAQVDDPPPEAVRLADGNAGPLSSGTTRALTASGLDTSAAWTVMAIARPVASNGIDGSAGFAGSWPVQTVTAEPVELTC